LWGHLRDQFDLLDRTLEETKVKFRSIFENEHTIMFLVDPENSAILDANIAAQRFYGYDFKAFLAMHFTDLNIIKKNSVKDDISSAVLGEKNKLETKHRKADGSIADVTIYLNPFQAGTNNKTLLFCIVHDMSDLVHVIEELQTSEARFRMLVDHAPEANYIHSGGEFVFLNPMAVELFGAKAENDLLGKSIDERFPDSYQKKLRNEKKKLYEDKKIIPYFENSIVKLDGTLVDTEMSSVPVPYKDRQSAIVFARDVSERNRLKKMQQEMEAHLLQQQKLESIGTLAGGVAHEINNPISGVMNYAQLILDDAPAESSLAVYASEIIHETERVANIVRNLLQFSRHEKQTHSLASMYDIIDHTVSLIRTIIKKDQIELVLDIEENLPNIKCRSQQIQQVLMNLLTNSRDALNEKYTDYDENKKIILRCYRTQDNGIDYVTVSVKDFGSGISAENLGRIFEPFFSTKPKDKGTGLGMSISFGIINDHNGKIHVDTKEGEYTEMIVDFPVDNGWKLEKEQENA
jgi:PAS domain S-box-containing protein